MIVPIRSVDALVQRIEWCMANKSELSEMGRIAFKTAKSFTWEKFRNEIRDFYIDKTIDVPIS
jgi:glycosyltransferase involved in cell wall biosynthesis